MEPIVLALIVFELVVMALSISLHDLAQAWMANRLGDPTARMLGRISINPLHHFDLFGMALCPLLSIVLYPLALPFGWGAPVPMTFRNFRSTSDENKAIAAGAGAQLIAAAVSLLVLVILKHTVYGAAETLNTVERLAILHGTNQDLASLPGVFPVMLLLYISIMVNLLLCVLNLLPMPFLDGGKILVNYLPYNAARSYERAQMFFTLAFFFLAYPLTMLGFKPLLLLFTELLDRL